MDKGITAQVVPRLGEVAALLLWDSGAFRVNLGEPFKLASGNWSPIYVNCRQVISSPRFMSLFTAAAWSIRLGGDIRFDIVAGGETAGIPLAAYVAQAFSAPLVYVRKAAKGHGIGSLVEGGSVSGRQVLLVEDLITDAGSKLHFIEALCAAGGAVEDVLVLFDRQQGGREALAERGIRLHAVADLETALSVAENAALLTTGELAAVREYLKSPRQWHLARGLEFTA